MALEAVLLRAWSRRGPIALALTPLAGLMHVLVAARRGMHALGLLPAWRAPVPVVVVGNVIAGGAGKTPTVMAIVAHLRSRGWRPAIVSRGHGRRADACLEVRPDTPVAVAGDEPVLLSRASSAPVFVARQRAQAVQAALKAHPRTDIIVSDDGLQHLALRRDVEIVVFDDRGVGNGWLLPAGPLREPWPRKADLVLCTGRTAPDLGQTVAWQAPRQLADEAVDAHGVRVPLSSLMSTPVDAVAAIANPGAFFDMLRARGLSLATATARPDHDALEPSSLPPRSVRALLCTEKDAVKIWAHRPEALAVPMHLELPADFLDRLDQLLSPHGQQAH